VLGVGPYENDQGRSEAPSTGSVSGWQMNICGEFGGSTEVQCIRLPTVNGLQFVYIHVEFHGMLLLYKNLTF
jgi:hypothetical protein